jgi:hypothetical protein
MTPTPDPIAEADARRNDLLARLRACPPVHIVGLVDGFGAGGGKSRGETHWTLRAGFVAWRVAGQPLRKSKLHLLRTVTDQELDDLRKAITPDSILRIRARLFEEDGAADALLEAVLGPESSDAELSAHAAHLRKRVTREDPILGTLTLDRRFNQLTARASWNGRPAEVRLDATTKDDFDAAIRAAHTLWQDQISWDRRVLDCALAKLLPLKNSNWLDEDEREVTPDQFTARMTLQTVAVRPDGHFEFWYRDGDLFLGHSIFVSGTLAEGPRRASIAG